MVEWIDHGSGDNKIWTWFPEQLEALLTQCDLVTFKNRDRTAIVARISNGWLVTRKQRRRLKVPGSSEFMSFEALWPALHSAREWCANADL